MSSSHSPSADEQNIPPKGKRKARVSRKEEEEVFCFCRQPEGNRFMIGCDKCDEWYHGDCVSITRATGDLINQYYCKACIAKDPTLVITYEKKETELLIMRCIQCVNCLRLADCGECDNCTNKRGRCLFVPCLNPVVKPSELPFTEKIMCEQIQPSSVKSAPSALWTPVIQDEIFDTGSPTSQSKEEELSHSGRVTRGRKRGFRKEKQEKVITGTGREVQKQLRDEFDTNLRERLKSGSEAYALYLRPPSVSPRKDNSDQCPMHCQASGCTYIARANSKYCSESCGMAMARKRLLPYLPGGVQNYWRIKSVAVKESAEESEERRCHSAPV